MCSERIAAIYTDTVEAAMPLLYKSATYNNTVFDSTGIGHNW